MKKVIVTGANGFIGTALLKELSDNGVAVIAIVREKSQKTSHIEKIPNVRVVCCNLSDINSLENMIEDRDVDACIHLGWEGSTGDARADYALQLTNVKYAVDLINVLNKMGIKRYVGVGTLAEKDVLNYHPTDGATPNAVSIYGIAKVSAHFMTKAECTKLGIEHIWCYLSNTFGVDNRTDNFVNFACKRMLLGQRAAFTAGEQVYDFVYITDTVKAIFAVASKGKINTSYYLGSTKPRKLKEYIKIMRDTIDPAIPLYLGEIPFKGISLEMEDYDTSKLIKDTGYTPTMEFEEGIKLTVDWLKQELKNEKEFRK